jgi:carboxyl-terminal processing protease
MPLSHGGAVKLTTSRYFTPSGASIHGKGIVPDVLEAGPGEAPAELAVARGSPSLIERDTDVRIGLEALKSRVRGVRSVPTLVTRAVVP